MNNVRLIAAIKNKTTPPTTDAQAAQGLRPTPYKVATERDMAPVRRLYLDAQGVPVVNVGDKTFQPVASTLADVEALAMVVRPRLECSARFTVGGLQVAVRWERPGYHTFTPSGGAWAIAIRHKADGWHRVAGGEGFRPSALLVANHGEGSREVGLSLLEMATACLPESGSGIQGDEASLKDWTGEGIETMGRSSVHDDIAMLTAEGENKD